MITEKRSNTIFSVLIFMSGASALIYEILWTRMLSLVFGITLVAVSTVLATFMAGLALGSFVFGRVIDKTSRSPLIVYAVLEIGIGLAALAIPSMTSYLKEVEKVISYSSAAPLFLTGVRFALCFLILIVPTTLMGGTFPIMCAVFRNRLTTVGQTAGSLYASNTFGAVAGAFLTGFVLIEKVGVKTTNHLAVVLNVIVAIMMIILSNYLPTQDPHHGRSNRTDSTRQSHLTMHAPPDPEESATYSSLRWDFFAPLLLSAVFWAGCAALSYEVLWTRLLIVYLESTIYAFTIILMTFLIGLAVGSFFFGMIADRIKHPFLSFGIVYALAGLAVLMGIPVLNEITSLGSLFKPLKEGWPQLIFIKFFMAFAVMFIPALLCGALMPLAIKLSLRESEEFGVQTGLIYSVNTLGAIIGSLLPAFLMIPTLGIKKSILLIAATQSLIGALLLFSAPFNSPRKKMLVVGGIVATILLCVTAIPIEIHPDRVGSGTTVSTHETRTPFRDLLFYKEGLTAIVSVFRDMTGQKFLDINGFEAAGTGPVYHYMRMLGHIPMLLQPRPRTILVVGLGTGTTAGSASLYDIKQLDIVEINPDIIAAAGYFSDVNHGVLTDSRTRVIVNDARNYLLVTQQRYDVITAEPMPPHFAGTVNLYSREYYELCANRLTDQGIVIQWLPPHLVSDEESRMILKTFTSVFSSTLVWLPLDGGAVVLVGTRTRFLIDYDQLSQRFLSERIRKDLAEVGLFHVEDLLNNFIMNSRIALDYSGQAPLITDDRPYLEFLGPKVLTTSHIFTSLRVKNLSLLTKFREEIKPHFLTHGTKKYVSFD